MDHLHSGMAFSNKSLPLAVRAGILKEYTAIIIILHPNSVSRYFICNSDITCWAFRICSGLQELAGKTTFVCEISNSFCV